MKRVGVVNVDNQECPNCMQHSFSGISKYNLFTKVIGEFSITTPILALIRCSCSICGYEEDYDKQESEGNSEQG